MKIPKECQKIKRTGFLPLFVFGGLFASLVPLLNTALRTEVFIHAKSDPLNVLFDANWQMIALINVLLLTAGACLMYHIEYARRCMEKMRALPIKESAIFSEKCVFLAITLLGVLALESVSLGFCVKHWFSSNETTVIILLKYLGCLFLLMLPAVLLALLIASLWENMWVSLGVGVIGIFVATMLPMEPSSFLSLFPFALPFQTPFAMINYKTKFISAVIIESLVIIGAEIIFLNVRRKRL